MPDLNIDFEGSSMQSNTTNQTSADQTTNQATEPDTTSLDGNIDSADITSKDGNITEDSNSNNTSTQVSTNEDDSSDDSLHEGDKVDFEGTVYSVDDKGNLVDDKGTIFKEAKDVKDWLNSVQNADPNDFSINAIQDAIGFDVVDSDGNPLTFTNDVAGVKAYVDAVLDLKSTELEQGVLNKFYDTNPIVKQFVDYLYVNNGNPRGFGEMPDRSNVKVIKDNEQQQEYIIRMAAQEFGNKSLNDGYIKYLKDTGGLYDEAVNQLQALVEKDKYYQAQMAEQAKQARNAEIQQYTEYWNNVYNVINGRTIAGYKLPESFVKEVNGRKHTLTPSDFYDYLTKQTEVDADGNKTTGYQKDLRNLSNDALLHKELLDAWLMFTGGTYKDLIDMAVNEDKVRVLKVKAKEQRNSRTIKVVKAAKNKADLNDILL